MLLEVMLSVVEKVSEASAVITLLMSFFGLFVLVDYAINKGEEDSLLRKLPVKPLLAAFTIFGLMACLPTVDDLWKVRIGLIKLELSSPENINKGVDVIERLGKKLEEKYLGVTDEGEGIER